MSTNLHMVHATIFSFLCKYCDKNVTLTTVKDLTISGHWSRFCVYHQEHLPVCSNTKRHIRKVQNAIIISTGTLCVRTENVVKCFWLTHFHITWNIPGMELPYIRSFTYILFIIIWYMVLVSGNGGLHRSQNSKC